MIKILGTFILRGRTSRLIIVTVIVIWFSIFGIRISSTKSNKDSKPRNVIVTLIRSTNRSILLTINMIHSVTKFHPIKYNYLYAFLLFHDQNFTSAMRRQILSCVLKTNKQLQISFALVKFHTKVKPDILSREDKPIEYRMMCRFWSYDVFYHPVIVRGHYDYLMRMDDDSYFSDVIQKDLFSYMKSEKLDYIYRATYFESINPMKPILQRFLNATPVTFGCIYNNFFIIRLNWFYESKRVQRFLHALTQNDLMLRQYIGDGCVHAAILKVDNQVKAKRVTDIPYGHNFHLMPVGLFQWIFHPIDLFQGELKKSCYQLTVLRGSEAKLTQIKMS